MRSLIILALALHALVTSAFAVSNRPNVLVLIADQWRAQAFGYAGDPNVRTPNIDSLARGGVNFKNAVSAVPVCSPTRASLLTGQRATTHGVIMNDVPLRNESVTFAEVLKENGYDTGYVGKWHLNGDGHRAGFIPRERRQGFDYWKVLECTHAYNNSFYYGDSPEKLKWEGYDAIAQTGDAQQYIRNHAKSQKPFVFVLAWGPPHNPYNSAPEKYRAMYDPAKLKLRGNVPKEDEQKTRRDLAGYYAHCTALDDCVGNLLQTLKETGLNDNTLIIFTSDHGDMLGSHGYIRKQKPWDESIRIPLLYYWPRTLKPIALESVSDSEDVAPTLLGLCGVKTPTTMEGIDYSSYMRGGKNPSDDAALIACITPFGEWDRENGGKEFRGIRTPRYTYIRDLTGPWLLFDNEKDPLQLTNRIEDTKVQNELDRVLKKKLKQAKDDFQTGDFYVNKWGYKTNAKGTVHYTE